MWKTIQQIWYTYYGQLTFRLLILTVLGILVYVCGLFAYHAYEVRLSVQDRLGIYIYFDQTISMSDLDERALDLTSRLEGAGVSAQYLTRDDTFMLLHDRLPDISNELQKYGIENPLPATMYILVPTQEDLDAVKNILPDFENIIDNYTSLDDTAFSLDEQELRMQSILVISRRTGIISLGLAVLVFVSFIFTLIQIYTWLAAAFTTDLYIKRIAGMSYRSQKGPFITILWLCIFCVCMSLLVLVSLCIRLSGSTIMTVAGISAIELLAPDLVVYSYSAIMVCTLVGVVFLTRIQEVGE